VTLDGDTCYRALTARDARFDGVFFVGVATTGIYCRPVCRARTPGRDRCAFYRTAAEAEHADFRACFRCRPELAPGQGPVDAVPRLCASAVARIDAGFLNDASVDDLAAALGVSARHLRRAMIAELGVSPVELAQSSRLALAKQLLQDTALPLAEIAFASGFSSVRRFNAVFQERFDRPPSSLRRERGDALTPPDAPATLVLRLDYRPPLDWDALLAFLAARAMRGVELIEGGVYRRTVRAGAETGWVAVRRDGARDALRAEVSLSLAGALMPLRARLRALFDLDAHPTAVAAHLGRDPDLAALVARRPGLRLPGAFDAFETALRTILGQQISVGAAAPLSNRLAERLGEPIATPFPGLDRLSPTAEAVARSTEAETAALGMPGARARAILALAQAFAGGLRLDRSGDPEEAIARLVALPGVGDWTAQYLSMRALGWPDAFPASDLALRRALGDLDPRAATARAEAWRPFRAYAVMHLWTSLSEGAPR
jgi:AraC family transcriptional regulator, regulatory protein of adaptative response / DNA-3-methyladenine glycosylase II